MDELDIVERLRGKVRVPVNDGAGLLDGKDFFERTFPTSKMAMEAAAEIERLRAAKSAALKLADERAIEAVELRAQLASARKALEGIQDLGEGGCTAARLGNIAHAALRSLTDDLSSENDKDLPTANDVRGILSATDENGKS